MKATSKLVATAAVLGLAAGLLPGAAASGSGGSPTTTVGNVLRLHLNSDGNFFEFDPPDGSGQPIVKQAIATNKCAVSLDTTPKNSLVELKAAPAPPSGAVGLFGNGIGVKVSGEGTGTPCGRVDGLTQSLTLTLTGPLAGKLFSFAELDIEAKFDATIRADAYLGPPSDATRVGTTKVETGLSSDSGPDSADGDNYRVVVNPGRPFDHLVLSVDPSTPGGAISLEGGGDGTDPVPAPDGLGGRLGTSDSVFQLSDFDGTLDCNQSAPNVGGGDTPLAKLDRGQNDNCELIPYLLRTGLGGTAAQFVLLEKDLTGQDGANFRMHVTWVAEEAQNPLNATTIDYDGPGGHDPVPVVWCDGTPAAPTLPPPLHGQPEQTWCLTGQTAVLHDSNVQLSEDYFGRGDPVWAR